MTRDEAANILSNDIIDGHVEGNARFMDAFWFAVDNLKAELCEDAVSRADTLQSFESYCENNCQYSKKQRDVMCGACMMGDAIEIVESLPPVTPKPRTGKWIYEKRERLVNETDDGAVYVTDYWCKCSKCGGDFGYRKMKDAFCKYCGAKMEGESE